MMKYITLNKLSASVYVSGIIGYGLCMLGGLDVLMKTLLIFMALDFLSGLTIAAFWKKSKKSPGGALESHACWKGLIRKGGIMAVILISVRLDEMLGTVNVIRSAAIIFFIGNESISLTENFGIMGVPMPKIIKSSIDQLIKKQDT